jgi:hypothetical protein
MLTGIRQYLEGKVSWLESNGNGDKLEFAARPMARS